MSWVAFYAPMKTPDHPVPSGDRRIARLTLAALEHAGWEARTVSSLRIRDGAGDPEAQERLIEEAAAEALRLREALAAGPPALWFTYHSYYKAPDLLGGPVSHAFGIPYAISEPSISPRRRVGAWARFALASEAAIAAADRLFWTTARDRPGLEEVGLGKAMVHLPAFLDPGPAPEPRGAQVPLRLLTVAMMRAGDKVESYRRLAAALLSLGMDWRLDVHGDGAAAAEVRAMFAAFGERVTWHGESDAERLAEAYSAADLFVWPGVGEGVGMAYLEAQAAGLPVVAEDHAAQREIVAAPLCPPDAPAAFARAVVDAAEERAARGRAARAHVMAHHSLDAAAAILKAELKPLMERRR